MPYYNGHALVFGGNGAVGTACVSQYKANNWWVGCIELWKPTQLKDSSTQELTKSTLSVTNPYDEQLQYENLNKQANLNILTDPNKELSNQEHEILQEISKALEGNKVDVIICMASNFVPGNASDELPTKVDLMWKQNVWPSLLCVSIAVAHMKTGGLLCLPGAQAALQGTPTMIGYGLAKAAIHQLTKSLASEDSALPAKTVCIALLPLTIDTVINKQLLPQADISAWTPTKYVTDLLFKWSNGVDRPVNGSLVQFITRDFNTNISYIP